MNDKEFANYLLEWLWTSSEDICSKCAYDPRTRMCQNIGEEERAADKKICFRGLRRYADGKRYPECEGDFDEAGADCN